ncbi:MAG: hypothetical protein LM601_08030 [Candidatus Verstraetearchaeota archaeon]|nr:hypothetical protein [Candidatus Verstraetearchaeota archaeon]
MKKYDGHKKIARVLEDLLEDYHKIIEKIRNEVEKLRKEFDEEFGKYVENEYAYYDQIYSEENWWKTLKIKWGPEGIKKFIREYVRRCEMQGIDLWKYNLKNALKNAVKYDSPEASYEPLMDDDLFPSPPILEVMLEEETREYEVTKIFKDIYEKGLVYEIKKALEEKSEEAERQLKLTLTEEDYQKLFKMFVSIVMERMKEEEFIAFLEKAFRMEWEEKQIMYMSRKDSEAVVKEMAEKWAKIIERLVQENMKTLIRRVAEE